MKVTTEAANTAKNDDQHLSFSEITVDPNKLDSSVLNRLLEEIKVEDENRLNAYNRTHNRHNRGR